MRVDNRNVQLHCLFTMRKETEGKKQLRFCCKIV